MTTITVVSAVATKAGVTLYMKGGGTTNLSSKDHRTHEIVKEVQNGLRNATEYKINIDSHQVDKLVERKTGGLLKFAIRKISSFWKSNEVPQYLGRSVSDPVGSLKPNDNETVVAIVDNVEIPGVGAMSKQINHSAQTTKDCKGLTIFMKRMAAVQKDRKHSADELLRFMAEADLPIADDGCIIGYKTLKVAPGDYFVDHHSGTVRQRLGSRVSMPIDKVDDDRSKLCSTGLHVARRQYISGYTSDALTLVKVAPEDVISVPFNESSKMRAMAYHIVAVLNRSQFDKVINGDELSHATGGAQILADVIKGNHVGIVEEVVIGGNGADIKAKDKKIEVKQVAKLKPVKSLGEKASSVVGEQGNVDAGEIDLKSLKEERQAIGETIIDMLANDKSAQGDIAELVTTASDDPKLKAKRKSKPKPKPVKKPAESAKKKKAAKPAKKPPSASGDAVRKRQAAYEAVVSGEMSQRAAGKRFGVCPQTIRKMIRAAKDKS